MKPADLSPRRSWLQSAGGGFGWLAFSALVGRTHATDESATPPVGKAKKVIFLNMKGGPSHVDTFDYKPELERADGTAGPKPGSKWKKSPWRFQPRGQAGLWISDLFPELGAVADELLIVNSMQTDVPSHPQASMRLHTGTSQFVRPSVGSWVLYGLGSDNDNLPGFISISSGRGAHFYGNAFLPASYQGMRLGNENRDVEKSQVANLAPLAGEARQRRELEFIQSMNRKKIQMDPGDAEIEGVIHSYELAFKMQGELPRVMDIASETEETQRLYGLERSETRNFGAKCLMARRMVESGVRFVEITHGNWDHHNNIEEELTKNCVAIDRPLFGLLSDLKQRGLLDETLVVWTGEFGRTPFVHYSQGRDGRDHNHKAFSLWMAGGGVAGGRNYGSSGDLGAEAVENPVPVVDFHATLLALLGLNHENLTYRYAGRDFRLTDTKGRIIADWIAS